MPHSYRSRISLVAVVACVVSAALLPSAQAGSTHPSRPRGGFRPLDLGPAGLVETRTTTQVQPGVTLTVIHRGRPDPADFWTVDVVDTIDMPSPDPDAPAAVIFSQASANAQAAQVKAAGFPARVETVTVPPTADYYPGVLGYRVRVGRFTTQAAATTEKDRITAAGFTAASDFTGWDGSATDKGPWRIQVLTIDPGKLRGSIKTSFGPDIENRETTSQLAALDHASGGINAGYFVLNPAAGAAGDPAGVGVYRGRLLSEPTNGLPGLVLHSNARHTTVKRLGWRGTVTSGSVQATLHGVDRVPGLIRNCGGQPGDLPTSLAQHDVTCTSLNETVLFTARYGPMTPTGAGIEVVVDHTGRIVSIAHRRGVDLHPGQRSIQAIGSDVGTLTSLVVGQKVRVETGLIDSITGAPVTLTPDTYIANGGPVLVEHGQRHVTPLQDGLVRATEPSEYYGFSAKRNPRTLAGTTADGLLGLITADGRSTASLGLSITEEADVSRSLGLTEAMNLDGGGSTTMVVHGTVINAPSDTTGERPVGDALLIDAGR